MFNNEDTDKSDDDKARFKKKGGGMLAKKIAQCSTTNRFLHFSPSCRFLQR